MCCSSVFRNTLIALLWLFFSYFWFSDRRPACLSFLAVCRGSEGRQLEDTDNTTTSTLGKHTYNFWHLAFLLPSTFSLALPAYPSRLALFLSGLFLHMQFYNFLLERLASLCV